MDEARKFYLVPEAALADAVVLPRLHVFLPT
jgi:hypothetical protein